MKKIVIIALAFALLVSSCSNNTGTGTAVGAQFGSVLGSAIGGLTGGRYGRELGTVIGMAGGAAAGAAIGSAADKKQKRQMEEYQQQAEEQYQQQQGQYQQPQAGSQQQADDRIDFDGAGPRTTDHGGVTVAPRTDNTQGTIIEQLSPDTSLEIRNIRFINGAKDGIIYSGEQCQLTFEVMNLSTEAIRNVRPMVTDLSNNKYLKVSPNLVIESIPANSGVRYTATILADSKLKDGEATIRVSVCHGELEVSTQTKEFTLTTRKSKSE
ncbi:MAG: hypothetical protein IJS95_00870 [Prevotella sp.]|nr:hypothetical protein [Prevotella sp.]